MSFDLSLLTPDEARFIELRFGLVSGYPATLEELADLMGVRRERVRMIEQRLVRKLRSAHRDGASMSMS
jgi:DNA-directed RNA polymerase sigma subunit (sigma70/sigma32)